MSIKNWSNKMIVNRNKKKHDTKMKTGISKCSKLKRAISHKILKKTSNKQMQEKTSNSSVLLISMISTANEKKILAKNENAHSEKFFNRNLLQPLDVVIEEARYQLSIEKLKEEKIGQFEDVRYRSNFSCSQDCDDIYEDMELLQTFYESIYDDYMDMCHLHV